MLPSAQCLVPGVLQVSVEVYVTHADAQAMAHRFDS